MKRTLMQRDQELLDFEVDSATGDARVLDASTAALDSLASAGFAGADMDVALGKLLEKRSVSRLRQDLPHILAAYHARSGIELSLMGRGLSLFDYDGAFGFPYDARWLPGLCKEPILAMLMCANHLSHLDPSWDWSWYDPRALEGFEGRVKEAYAPFRNLPPNFSELVAGLFDMQRTYVTKVASAQQ